MTVLDIMPGTWSCTHTDHIKRCARCNLVFCGTCNCLGAKKRTSSPDQLISFCPKCGEVATIILRTSNMHTSNGKEKTIYL